MSNARILADLMGTSTTVPSSKLSLAAGDLPAGSQLQVQRTQFTGTNSYSISSNTDTVITDLTVNITPTSTSSVIRLDAMINGEWSTMAHGTDAVWYFYRDSTKLSHAAAGNRNVGILMGTAITYYADDAASTPEQAQYCYFDTPSTTSQITYKVGVRMVTASTWYLNRTVSDTDNGSWERGISFISATEIAG